MAAPERGSGSGVTPKGRRALSEGAHKMDAPPTDGAAPSANGPKTGVKRNFNEAAHKLGYWPVTVEPRKKDNTPSAAIRAAADDERDVVAHAGKLILALGALGIVYGDLGTSPLYTVQTIFTQHADAARPTIDGIYGISSLIFWALIIEVSIKYAGFIMRAHNRGDGGIMALSALIQRRKVPRAAALVTLGLLGAGLFFGDGMITPAISVTSAVEGLKVATPSLSHLVIPISLAILVGLFAVQRYGTGAVGWMFGPVILVWFAIIAALGLVEVAQHPGVVQGLSPTWAAKFMIDHGVDGWLTLGGVVLCVTGAEALYADRGHFGAGPIRATWFSIVLPAVMLNYLGQSALILHNHAARENPFYLLAPSWGRLPLVFLATAATIIASQAALTGSFSVAKQAVQLGFLPRVKIVHTSELEGQIYVPLINWALCAGVVTLVLVFRSSTHLADIYGVAVTGTFILDTTLFLAVARSLWGTAKWKLAILGAVFYTIEIAFFTSNLSKVGHGAWLPLLVGLVVATIMVTWRKGRDVVTHNRTVARGLARRVPRRPVQRQAAHRAPARHRHLPQPGQGDHAAGAARPGRAQPRLPREGGDRLDGPGQHPARGQARPLRLRAAGQGPVQDPPHHRARRLPRQLERPRGAGRRPQARLPGPQPRSRARVLLRLAHDDRPHQRAGHVALAQDAVHRDGAQRHQPDRSLPPAEPPHRDDGLPGRDVT